MDKIWKIGWLVLALLVVTSGVAGVVSAISLNSTNIKAICGTPMYNDPEYLKHNVIYLNETIEVGKEVVIEEEKLVEGKKHTLKVESVMVKPEGTTIIIEVAEAVGESMMKPVEVIDGEAIAKINIGQDGAEYEVTISKGEENGTLKLTSNNVSAFSRHALSITKDGKIYQIKDLEEETTVKEVKLLPDMASKKAESVGISINIKNIELGNIEGRPTYIVDGTTKGKLFGLFPVSLNTKLQINAITGTIETIKKPWWDVFVGE